MIRPFARALCIAFVAADLSAQVEEGRLSARPAVRGDSAIRGERYIVSASGEGYTYVPPTYRPDVAMPLCVMLHGAGGNAQRFIRRFESLADSAGIILVAPQSHLATWDLMHGTFGYDVIQIDAMLRDIYRRFRIDTARTCIAGFSDGASYALSLGRVNGDLFTHVIAFSPGFIVTAARAHGKPSVFVSHGSTDNILPIDRTGRRVVATLTKASYKVEFREFTGPHTVPPDIAVAAFAWLKK
jgi:phospholipase/carboxylesterase